MSKRCSAVATLHATRCHNLILKCTKFDFGSPRPRWGSLRRSPDPLLLLRGREGKGEEGRGVKERGREGRPVW